MHRLYTLPQALALADPSEIAENRSIFGSDLFAQAVEAQTRNGLRADIVKGSTRDRDGFRSQFIAYDWEATYRENPSHIWSDYFRPAVMNSASRMQRGLAP
ncbi:hypothetical protein [Variovorax sp. V15]|uniref:hypothetical protein n=1 Tax=Variovorax sp. V15 TaxID=3065952 RepID=UPI0034E8781A